MPRRQHVCNGLARPARPPRPPCGRVDVGTGRREIQRDRHRDNRTRRKHYGFAALQAMLRHKTEQNIFWNIDYTEYVFSD